MPLASENKIKKLKELAGIISRLRKKGSKVVFTNGCFDLLHWGHVKYLREARKKGDLLVVALNSDSSVKRIKGKKRPVVKQLDRARVLSGLESVDYIVIFKEDTPLNTIRCLRPDILVKGADWGKKGIVGADFIKNNGGRVYNIKLVRGSSTSKLIKKIAKTF